MNTQISTTEKLRVVSRRDLHIGVQATQAGHAAIQFQHEHSDKASAWYNISNHLGFLAAKDEQELKELIQRAEKRGLNISIFREPDLDNVITAVAIEASDDGRRITSQYPLLGKGVVSC